MMQGLVKFLAKKKDTESIAFFDKAVSADSTYSFTYFWRGLGLYQFRKTQRMLEKLEYVGPASNQKIPFIPYCVVAFTSS